MKYAIIDRSRTGFHTDGNDVEEDQYTSNVEGKRPGDLSIDLVRRASRKIKKQRLTRTIAKCRRQQDNED